MISSISKTGKSYFLKVAVPLMVLFILAAGSVYANWLEMDKLLSADGAADDWFGKSVSVNGDYAIVGAAGDYYNGSRCGSAYIFTPNDVYPDGWDQVAKLTASDGASDDFFGWSVSISGDYAIVGAFWDDDNGTDSGSAYIFKRSGTNWTEQAKLTASNGAAGDEFGKSVSISGDYAIVGALYGDDDDPNFGSAYIFYYDGTSWSEQAKLTASDGATDDWFGSSVSISGDYVIVGAHGDDDNGLWSGSAYIFKRDGTNWSEQAKLTASDAYTDDRFGRSVSIDGDYAIVGAYRDDDSGNSSGSAYIFKHSGTSWNQQAKLLPADGAVNDLFGHSVSISGDYAIAGAYGDDDSGVYSGSAYIFKRNGTNWSQQAKLLAADGAADEFFGYSVSIGGVYAIAGAYFDDDSGDRSGSAYIFKGFADIRGTKWHDRDGDGHFVEDTDEQRLEGWRIYIDDNENGQFDSGEPNDITDAGGNYRLMVPVGTYLVAEEERACWEQTYPGGDGTYNVTLEAGEIAAGYNFGNAQPGEIHSSVFQQEKQDKLVASDGAAGDWFGRSVSVSGGYAIVGANYDDDSGGSSGSAYIFAPNDVNCDKWDQIAKLAATDAVSLDFFGWSVSVNGAYAIVGAYGDDDGGDFSGSAYIFTPSDVVPNNWDQVAKLIASDGAANDWFGYSVSISGGYAIVGAYQDDDNGGNSGSAYIFKRIGTSWSEQAKLTASDGAADDWFGYSVSISGDYAIVGAYGDDDNGSACGSAYIFKRDGTNWFEQVKLLASDGAAGDSFGRSVSISGDYAIAGAYFDDDNGSASGSAYIFKRSVTSWNEQAKLTASDGAIGDWFGSSVSVSGDYAIVGADRDDDGGANSGSAYIFQRNGASWNEQAKLTASDDAADDYFGRSVSISGAYALVGAYWDDDNGANSGSAYLFGKVLCPISDLTGNCLVDFKDFAIMAGEWLHGAE